MKGIDRKDQMRTQTCRTIANQSQCKLVNINTETNAPANQREQKEICKTLCSLEHGHIEKDVFIER